MITEEMIHSAKNGDETAFETIFEESKEDILTVINCEFSFRNQQDTDDILQNIYAKIFMYIGTVRNPLAFCAWVKTVTRNECILYYNKTSKNNFLLYSEEIEEFEEKVNTNTGEFTGLLPHQKIDKKGK